MIPFFVVDRPISLKIIGGLSVPPGKRIGLMAHANTSQNFRNAFRDYSHQRVVKMCDSAIFDERRDETSYADLYARYEEMGADYGVMIDILRDSDATLKSASEALEAYRERNWSFTLVGVAQGRTVEEYLDCYQNLQELGIKHIAIGGLLQKRNRSARYLHVHDEDLMRKILSAVRETFNPTWLFALGCLHTSRLSLFKKLNVWGDYKGWIFEYDKRDVSIKESVEKLSINHLRHAPARFQNSSLAAELITVLAKREKAIKRFNAAHLSMLDAKRQLRDTIIEIEIVLQTCSRALSKEVSKYRSRGLITRSERNHILRCLNDVGLEKKYTLKLNGLIKASRKKKNLYVAAEARKDEFNRVLALTLVRVRTATSLDAKTKTLASKILTILNKSEQSHRIAQVRTHIQKNILQEL